MAETPTDGLGVQAGLLGAGVVETELLQRTTIPAGGAVAGHEAEARFPLLTEPLQAELDHRGLGVKVGKWLFAHPENKKNTGPYARFRIMIYGNQYRSLLNHSSHKINLLMNTPNKHIFKIEILAKDKKLLFYEWHVEKASEKNCNDCWFTSAVSIPIDQGNTI